MPGAAIFARSGFAFRVILPGASGHEKGSHGGVGPQRIDMTPQTNRLRLRTFIKRTLVRIRRRVPPGLRVVLGLLMIVGGAFGFLPVLGFWMIPLGVGVAALDVKPMMARLRGRKSSDSESND